MEMTVTEVIIMTLSPLTGKSFYQENHCMINKPYFYVWYNMQVNHYITTKLNVCLLL